MFLNPGLSRQLTAEHRRGLTPSAAETAWRQQRRQSGHPAARHAITVRTIFRRITPGAGAHAATEEK